MAQPQEKVTEDDRKTVDNYMAVNMAGVKPKVS